MNMETIGLGISITSLLLLLLVAFQLTTLRKPVAPPAEPAASRVRRDQDNQDLGILLHEIIDAQRGIHEQLARLGRSFTDMEAQLGVKTDSVGRPGAERRSAGVPPPQASRDTIPQRILRGMPGDYRSGSNESEREDRPLVKPLVAQPFVTTPATSSDAEEAGKVSQPIGALLDEYRQLISEPRKSEINRWADERGGASCVVNDDGTISRQGRDAGGLLILLDAGDGSAVVVPGGRMVVEFATSFADRISMRGVTRECFELLGDGSGILRVIEPARVVPNGDQWVVAAQGKLSGFTIE